MDLPLPPDFKEFLLLLNSNQIDYLIVGGYAVSYHGYPRPTGDLDLWVGMLPGNAAKLVVALDQFGFGASGASEDLFLTPERIVRMGEPPVRIELLTSVSGVSFDVCHARRVSAVIDGVPVSVISRDDLIVNKTAAGRDRDKDDVRRLRG
jgi:predicted nucleotidyltransferase